VTKFLRAKAATAFSAS